MTNDPNTDKIDVAFNQLVAAEKGLSQDEITPEAQEKFLRGYSIGALVFSTIYFWAMSDQLYFWISVPAALFFPPLLLYFPVNARRRARDKYPEKTFAEYKRTQKNWDLAGWWCIILMVIGFYLLYHFVYLPLLNSLFPSGVDINQLNQMRSELQDLTAP